MHTRHDWDALAADYDSYPDHGLFDPDTRAAWKDLLRTWLPARPAQVVDLGCGTGSLSALTAELGHEVIAVDSSGEMIARARAKLAPFGAAATVLKADVNRLRLDPACADVLLARHVLWALPDPQDVLRRWVHLVRPGGRLLLVEGLWSGDAPAAGPDDPRMPWSAGVASADLRAVLEGIVSDVHVVPLMDPVLWGTEISQERYLAVAEVGRAPEGRDG